MAETHIFDPIKELGYLVKRESMLLTGKVSAAPAAEAVVGNIGVATGTAASGTLVGLLTIGGVAAVSAGLTQMDYNHKRQMLKELYKKELAQNTGKSVDKVRMSDLNELAKSNNTLNQELRRCRRQRNFGVIVSFLASMTALSVVAAIPAAFLGASGVAMFALHAIVGVATYHVVKDPLHVAADKLFGLDDRTTNDHIVSIARDREAGKVISREQVLSGFAFSNPELNKLIASSYGKNYEDLAIVDKQRAAQDISQIVPLDRLTSGINSGAINVTELAFAVEGKFSGVHKEGSEIHEVHKSGLKQFLSNVGQKINNSKVGQGVETVAAVVMSRNQYVTPIAGSDGTPAHKFVEKLGFSKKTKPDLYVERVEQSRSEQATTGIQQP